MSTAEILIRFFKFYTQEFDPEEHLINISSKGKPFLRKHFAKELFHNKLWEKHRPLSHYFLIRDPFNNTYNPAKNISLENALETEQIK